MSTHQFPEAVNTYLAQLKFLRLHEVQAIEDALKQVGSFGEVHLVVEHGRLRYVRTLKSEPVRLVAPPTA